MYEFKIQTSRKFMPQLADTLLAETQGNHAFSLHNNYHCEQLCLLKNLVFFSKILTLTNSFQMFQCNLILISLYVLSGDSLIFLQMASAVFN